MLSRTGQSKGEATRCGLSWLTRRLKCSIRQPYITLGRTLTRRYPTNICSETLHITDCPVVIALDAQTRLFKTYGSRDQLIVQSGLCQSLHYIHSLIKHMPDILNRCCDDT